MLLSNATLVSFRELKESLTGMLQKVQSFEEAAQQYSSAIYETFEDATVLIRLFVVVPYGELPPREKDFVHSSTAAKGIHHDIHDYTPILTLLGTRGAKPAWNDRTNSQGHRAVPLISQAFTDLSPMIPGLLTQLGMDLKWIDLPDGKLFEKTGGIKSGVFFVSNAADEVDLRKHHVISDQKFVTNHGVKTVFGFGSGYLGTQTFTVTVMFLRETLEKHKAEQFAARMSFFKAGTVSIVKKRIFS